MWMFPKISAKESVNVSNILPVSGRYPYSENLLDHGPEAAHDLGHACVFLRMKFLYRSSLPYLQPGSS